jgi:hypothetical protein
LPRRRRSESRVEFTRRRRKCLPSRNVAKAGRRGFGTCPGTDNENAIFDLQDAIDDTGDDRPGSANPHVQWRKFLKNKCTARAWRRFSNLHESVFVDRAKRFMPILIGRLLVGTRHVDVIGVRIAVLRPYSRQVRVGGGVCTEGAAAARRSARLPLSGG